MITKYSGHNSPFLELRKTATPSVLKETEMLFGYSNETTGHVLLVFVICYSHLTRMFIYDDDHFLPPKGLIKCCNIGVTL